MDEAGQRAALAALMAEQGATLSELSRVIGRNPAYLQQYLRRGTPRLLAEPDRAKLARFFGVAEARLGGPERAGLTEIARVDIGASAGPGGIVDGEFRRPFGVPAALLDALGVRPDAASMIRVQGDSMAPTLEDGDEILVDRNRCRIEGRRIGVRGGIHVLRVDGLVLVKRLRVALGGIELVSDNPDYPVRLCRTGDVEVLGRVVWLGRSL